MLRVAIFGMSYLGLTGAVALSGSGVQVVGIESDCKRLESLVAGIAPVFEPGLQDALDQVRQLGRVEFVAAAASLVEPVDFALICVGTPSSPDGNADLSQVAGALADIELSPALTGACIVLKSTVPPGTSRMLLSTRPWLKGRLLFSPDFLNQGRAIEEWNKPDRVVVGCTADSAPQIERFASLSDPSVPVMSMSLEDAELVKYYSNLFVAAKISFANEVATVCETFAGDAKTVVAAVGADKRIGADLLWPGVGYGDSCLPKDTRALTRFVGDLGLSTPMLEAVVSTNLRRRRWPLEKLMQRLGTLSGRRIALVGLRNEWNSDDAREAVSKEVSTQLLAAGALVSAWEPVGARYRVDMPRGVTDSASLWEAVRDTDAVVVLCAWPEFVDYDWRAVHDAMSAQSKLLIDGVGSNASEQWPGPYEVVGRVSGYQA